MSKYPETDGLNWEGIKFPTKVTQIRKLEKQNEGLAINVWGWENDDLTILWISDKSKEIKRINLMLLMDGERSHYCWITEMSRLIFNKTKNAGHYCGQSHRRCRWQASCESEEEVINGRVVMRYFPIVTPCNKRKPKDLTDRWIEKSSETCLFCAEPLLRQNYRDAVKDHCHITGKFRGAAHVNCKRS